MRPHGGFTMQGSCMWHGQARYESLEIPQAFPITESEREQTAAEDVAEEDAML